MIILDKRLFDGDAEGFINSMCEQPVLAVLEVNIWIDTT